MRVNQYKPMLDVKTQLAYLVKEKGFNYSLQPKLTDSDKIYDFMVEEYRINEEAVEHMYMLAFNTRMKLIGTFKISQGTINSTIVSQREVVRNALLCNAESIVLVHNHPSSDVEPSQEDFTVTRKVNEACKLMNITMMDHIIIGEGYTSFKKLGYL